MRSRKGAISMSKMPQPAKINEAEKFRGDVIFFIVGFFIIHLFVKLLDFFFSPLKAFSAKEAADKVDEKIEEKRRNRFHKRRKIDLNDPMEQFYLRFVENPLEYKEDTENEVYFAWFNAWKKGKIIDSDLRWAPDILDGGEIRDNFIHYMKIQLALHKKASFLRKMQFTNTIFRFYPELSANLKRLEEDLAQYDSEIKDEKAESELEEEIKTFGLPELLAKYLAEKDINAKALRNEAIFLKSCSKKGYCPDTCIFAVENNITNEDALKTVEIMVKEMGLPSKVVMAFFRREINGEQVGDLVEFMAYIHKSWGNDLFTIDPKTNETHYEGFIDAKLKEYRGKKIIKHLNGDT
jgi:hypothetical protein